MLLLSRRIFLGVSPAKRGTKSPAGQPWLNSWEIMWAILPGSSVWVVSWYQSLGNLSPIWSPNSFYYDSPFGNAFKNFKASAWKKRKMPEASYLAGRKDSAACGTACGTACWEAKRKVAKLLHNCKMKWWSIDKRYLFSEVDISAAQLFRHSGDGDDDAGFPEGLAERLRRAEAEVEELRRLPRQGSGGYPLQRKKRKIYRF